MRNNFYFDHLGRKQRKSGQKHQSLVFDPSKNHSWCKKMNFLTNFFKSPDMTPKIKNVVEITSFPSSGWSTRIVKIFLDKKILQAGDNFSKNARTSRGRRKIFSEENFLIFFTKMFLDSWTTYLHLSYRGPSVC